MEVPIEELEERLKNRIVGDVLERMIMDIDLMPPNGAKVHKRITLKMGLYYCLDNRKDQGLSNKTFVYHRKKDKKGYDNALRLIKETMEYLNLTV